ncbi:M48 family metalloprotease [Halosimplex litoreum]|uniref:M48 family metalloprotease n=1 Tax=Halosimplex litoreum TaxID=1198301 RepID=A0A7T3FWQ9_9EURY|nr:M48 family metalloprotease [Halosimplex litoreum]QPV62042.1 M48 family metalloprotease [Halosimplex litoreum]
MRWVLRGLMIVVGVLTLAVYLAGAYLVYEVARAVWAIRPPLGTLALYLAVLTVVFAFVSYRVGTAQILRSLQVWELPEARAPMLYRRLGGFSDAMGIERPDVLVAEMGQPNALALGGGFGRGHVVVDRRLFSLLTFEELSAILAHELAHIERKDSLVQTVGYSALRTLSGLAALVLAPVLVVAAGLARGVAWIRGRPEAWTRTIPGKLQRAVVGTVSLVFFALTLAILAHSRRREFAADDRAAAVTGDPLALARALRKIERASEGPWSLLSPLYVDGEEEGPLTRLLSTHPATDERVERLQAWAERDEGIRVERRRP